MLKLFLSDRLKLSLKLAVSSLFIIYFQWLLGQLTYYA